MSCIDTAFEPLCVNITYDSELKKIQYKDEDLNVKVCPTHITLSVKDICITIFSSVYSCGQRAAETVFIVSQNKEIKYLLLLQFRKFPVLQLL